MEPLEIIWLSENTQNFRRYLHILGCAIILHLKSNPNSGVILFEKQSVCIARFHCSLSSAAVTSAVSFRAVLLQPLDHSEKPDQFIRIKTVVTSIAFKEAMFSDHVDVEICPAHNDTGITPLDSSLTFIHLGVVHEGAG